MPFVRVNNNTVNRAIELIEGQSYMLITDADGIFDASSTVEATAVATGGVLNFGQVSNFVTRPYFTIATFQAAPGGVVAGYTTGLRVELYNEFPSGNTSATDSVNAFGTGSPYSVPHQMFYTNDLVNPEDADTLLGANTEEAFMEISGEMNFENTNQNVFNIAAIAGDQISLWIDDQLIINGATTANQEGLYTPTTTGWKKIRVKFANRGSTGNLNITYKNNASTCTGACINIPSSLFRVYAPQSAWYKAGTRQYTSWAGTTPVTTNNSEVFRWDSVSALQNISRRTDGGNTYRDNATDNINGNPVINNNADKFRVGVDGTLENRDLYTWGLSYGNTARTQYAIATAAGNTNVQHIQGWGAASANNGSSLFNSSGEISFVGYSNGFSEVNPGTIESLPLSNMPFVMGTIYDGQNTAVTGQASFYGNGKRTRMTAM